MGLKPETAAKEAEPPREEAEGAVAPKAPATESFYPHHFIRQVIQVLVVFAVLATLATFIPAPMGAPADPTKALGNISPEWVFLAAHHVIEIAKLLPVVPLLQQTIGVSIVAFGFLVMLLVPYLDRREERRPRKRPVALALLLLAVSAYVALTFWPQLARYLM